MVEIVDSAEPIGGFRLGFGKAFEHHREEPLASSLVHSGSWEQTDDG